LVGDFNIHICCKSNPLAREFINIIDAFDLTHWVNYPTHILGHTLDLVLSYGVDISDISVSDYLLSDHKPILFTMSLPSLSHVSTKTTSMSRVYSAQFSESFSQRFSKSCSHLLLESPLADLDADEHLRLLNSVWLEVLNESAPLRPLKHKAKSELWCTKGQSPHFTSVI